MLETIDFYKYSLPFELQYSNSTDQSMEREEAPMYEQRRSQGQYRKNRQQSQSRRSWRKLRQKVQIRTPSEQRELSYNYLSQLRQWEDKLDSIRIQLLSKQQLLLAQTKVLGISQQKDKESERVFWIKEIQQTEATLKQLFEQEKEVEKKIDKLKYYDDENVQNFKQWSKEQERDLREQHIEDQHQRRRALKAQVNLMHSSHQRSVSQAYQSQLRQKANKIILSRKMRGFKDKCLIEQTLCLSKAKEAYKLQWTGMVQKSRAAIIEFKEKEREAEQELEKLRKAYNAHKLKYKLRSKVYL